MKNFLDWLAQDVQPCIPEDQFPIELDAELQIEGKLPHIITSWNNVFLVADLDQDMRCSNYRFVCTNEAQYELLSAFLQAASGE